ncbi:hypothetical protein GGX14DRAFT_409341 [Mycena pura]|uniref:Uncharacterized protein n=1 Tax=Mycena pura TaxID=153505 RepID=A0AAD6Y0F3_9AGAR|nr:hypothetical protein GGX14DRAFT_409341 [Mycena pura]
MFTIYQTQIWAMIYSYIEMVYLSLYFTVMALRQLSDHCNSLLWRSRHFEAPSRQRTQRVGGNGRMEVEQEEEMIMPAKHRGESVKHRGESPVMCFKITAIKTLVEFQRLRISLDLHIG